MATLTRPRPKASPLARALAARIGVDLGAVRGSGPAGRIKARDVEAAGATAGVPRAEPNREGSVEYELRDLGRRATVAARMEEAWRAPAFHLTARADLSGLLHLRARLAKDVSPAPTVTDLLVKLVANALVRHRDLNATWDGERLRVYRNAHVGLAVAGPRGVVVPVLRNADRLPLADLAAERARLVAAARNATLESDALEGGTFTLSNLGMYGVDSFTAILNPPQVGILAVGAVEDYVVLDGGAPAVRRRMALTLTCDHRAVDGAGAADFLRTLKALVEEPALAL